MPNYLVCVWFHAILLMKLPFPSISGRKHGHDGDCRTGISLRCLCGCGGRLLDRSGALSCSRAIATSGPIVGAGRAHSALESQCPPLAQSDNGSRSIAKHPVLRIPERQRIALEATDVRCLIDPGCRFPLAGARPGSIFDCGIPAASQRDVIGGARLSTNGLNAGTECGAIGSTKQNDLLPSIDLMGPVRMPARSASLQLIFGGLNHQPRTPAPEGSPAASTQRRVLSSQASRSSAEQPSFREALSRRTAAAMLPPSPRAQHRPARSRPALSLAAAGALRHIRRGSRRAGGGPSSVRAVRRPWRR